ncbi:hypothetical protein AcV5_001738 [Taiwanofungus camphoratus]|nr:hypothetical protein AcV5_001738 [Antrodia cinnamomea]
MLTYLALFSVFFTTTSLALPGLYPRQDTSPCAGLGDLAHDTVQNFTLTAYNASLPPTDSTGAAPLVLGTGPSLPSGRASSAVLATAASYTYDNLPGPGMSLINGTLIPYPAANGLVASDIIVNAGDSLGFVVTYPEDLPAGAPIYCVVQHGAPSGFGSFASLAVNGDNGDFSLCLTEVGQNNVVWKATPNNDGQYDYDSCYTVRLQIEYELVPLGSG